VRKTQNKNYRNFWDKPDSVVRILDGSTPGARSPQAAFKPEIVLPASLSLMRLGRKTEALNLLARALQIHSQDLNLLLTRAALPGVMEQWPYPNPLQRCCRTNPESGRTALGYGSMDLLIPRNNPEDLPKKGLRGDEAAFHMQCRGASRVL
jgi:hypothetical protein